MTDKITKKQVISFLDSKEYFEDGDIIFFVEWKDEKTQRKTGIAFKFDGFGYLIDTYTWDDY